MNNRVVKVVKYSTDVTERVVAVKEIGAGLSRLADQDLTYEITREFNPSFENLPIGFQPLGRKPQKRVAADRAWHSFHRFRHALDHDRVG